MEKFQQVWLLLKNFGQTILVFFESILKFIANFYLNIIDYILNFFNLFFQFVANFWKYLNPSLFQNVILGILVIYVFVAEYVSREIKNQKERDVLYKMLATYEFVNIRHFFLSVMVLILFASFEDKNIDTSTKSFAFSFLIIYIILALLPLFKLQKFFKGDLYEVAISFLKSLNFSKIFRFINKTKSKKMIRAWQSVWSARNLTYEYELDFTDIFIIHIEGIIKLKKFYFTRLLFEIYLNNFPKRSDSWNIAYKMFPKILEWDEKIWYEEYNYYYKKSSINRKNIKENSEKLFSKKKISWVIKIIDWYKRNYLVTDRFFQYDYFRSRCLPVIVKELLKPNYTSQLFNSFKQHTQTMEENLNKITNKNNKEEYENYINQVFNKFFYTFFNDVNLNQKSFSSRSIGYYFPNEWRITISNIDEKNSSQKNILLRITYTFIKWARSIAFFTKDENQNLTAAVNLLFPKVHSSLFTVFLALLFNFQREIKYAIEKKPNFCIDNFYSIVFQPTGDENKNRRKQSKLLNQEKNNRKKETIDIILNFFTLWWEPLIHYKNDFTEDECKNWDSILEIDRKKKIQNIKIKKLKEVKIELENLEIKEIPNEEYRQENKKNCLELIELLIENLENKKTV